MKQNIRQGEKGLASLNFIHQELVNQLNLWSKKVSIWQVIEGERMKIIGFSQLKTKFVLEVQ